MRIVLVYQESTVSGSFDVRDQQAKFGPFVFILNKQTRFFRFVHGETVILPSQVSDL